jgi:SAM-dependent methyltransferase
MERADAKKRTETQDDWFVEAFGVLYPIIYAHRTAEAAKPEVHFAVQAINLKNNERALDLCCGAGRHLTTLQQFCMNPVGTDYSAVLLARARTSLNPCISLVRSDMRALPFTSCFDAVFSFFTSFGYFLKDADNLLSAKNMAHAIKAGGRFFMDYLNPSAVRHTLEPETHRRLHAYEIHELRWIDVEKHRVNKSVNVFKNKQSIGTTRESVRMYTFKEMSMLLSQAGLQIQQVYGDYAGAAYGENSPRMILTGTRKTV